MWRSAIIACCCRLEIDQELADLAPNTVDADSIIMDNILTVVFAKSSPSLFPIHLEMTKDRNVTINDVCSPQPGSRHWEDPLKSIVWWVVDSSSSRPPVRGRAPRRGRAQEVHQERRRGEKA